MRELQMTQHASELDHKERLARIESDTWADPAMAKERMSHERQVLALKSKQPAPGIDPQQVLQLLHQHIAQNNEHIAQNTQALHALAQAHSAPRTRRLIRDSQGRASHAIDEPATTQH
jgi:hypothetical protein